MAKATGLDAFLWSQVSQGYPRVVEDESVRERWRAWCLDRTSSRVPARQIQTHDHIRRMSESPVAGYDEGIDTGEDEDGDDEAAMDDEAVEEVL